MEIRKYLLGVFAASLMLLLAGCAGMAQPMLATQAQTTGISEAQPVTPAIAMGGELRVGLDFDIAGFDPAFAYDWVGNTVMPQVTEGLLEFLPDGTLGPNLAERWENPDPLTYHFYIRQGVTFHDGTPMTIDDVIFSMERIRDPDTGAWMGFMYSAVDTIERSDDWLVTVTLKEPDVMFPYAMATAASNVVSKTHFEADPEGFGTPEVGAIGTGPFKFISWSTGNEIVLERHDAYWNQDDGGPYLDRIVFKIVPDATAMIAALRTGELHLKFGIPADLLPIAESMDNILLDFVDYFGSECIAFNTQRPPFDNVKVRQALNYAVDTVEITNALLGKYGSPSAYTPAGPNMWIFEQEKWAEAFEGLPTYAKDMEKARQLLAESGVADQLNGKVITTHEGLTSMGHALALQDAAADLGIDFEILNLSVEDLVTTTSNGERDYDILRCGFASDFPDPASNFLSFFHSHTTGEGGFNFANYRNDEVDRLLDEQSKTSDVTKRTELLLQVQQIIAEDAPMIFFNYSTGVMALNKQFRGYEVTPLWYWVTWSKGLYMTE